MPPHKELDFRNLLLVAGLAIVLAGEIGFFSTSTVTAFYGKLDMNDSFLVWFVSMIFFVKGAVLIFLAAYFKKKPEKAPGET